MPENEEESLEEKLSRVVLELTVEKIEGDKVYCNVEMKLLGQPMESCPVE